MKLTSAIGFAAGLVSMLGAGVAGASYPAGVWVKVQSVQFEPSAAEPTRVRIHGVAMLYNGSSTGSYFDSYTAPARGVLYYECPSGQLTTCRDEWNDIVTNISAPLGVCVGLGDQSQPTGRLRRPDEAPGTADAYPIHMGVLEGFSPCEVIRQFLSGETDAGGGVGGTGTGGSGAGSAAGSSGSNPGTGGQGAASASSPASAAPEEPGCTVTAVPSSSAALTGLGLAALGVFALRRRRRA